MYKYFEILRKLFKCSYSQVSDAVNKLSFMLSCLSDDLHETLGLVNMIANSMMHIVCVRCGHSIIMLLCVVAL